MRRLALFSILLIAAWSFLWAQPAQIHFIFTSDVHYGITRPQFRGHKDVEASIVNAAEIAQMNRLPGPFDFVAIGGDITNRQEKGIQSAARSWVQFQTGYVESLKLHTPGGERTPLYLVPGNHDVSNAIGYYKPLSPFIDKTSLVEIFNLMMRPATPKTAKTFEYPRDRMTASRDIGGVHFVFITMWPDTRTRAWMENDLKNVGPETPVILFAHDPPDGDSTQFINPNGKHDINPTDQFENMLSDVFADGLAGGKKTMPPPLVEERQWEAFLHQHPNVTAYFHGHNNWNEFYDWTGPDHTAVLHTFRADSPMKGHLSAMDETKLSFQLATIDTEARTMTVREVLWNAHPAMPDAPITFGDSTTVALGPRPSAKR